MCAVPEKREVSRATSFLLSLHGAIILTAFLLGVMLLPQTYAVVRRVDTAAALQLNALIGQSPVFDRLLTLTADEDGRERLFFFVVVYCVVYAWRAPNRRERARRISSVLFIICIIGAAMMLEDFLDETYARKSPSMVLRPFKNVKNLYRWDISIHDQHSFPSGEGMVLLLTGFLLMRMRARWALAAVLAGCILPLGGCMVGHSWLSDVYLGALPLAFLFSALATETGIRRLQVVLYRLTLTSIDQAQAYWRKYRYLASATWLRSSSNVHRVESAIKQYLLIGLPSALGFPEETPERVETPLGGRRTLVRVVTFRGHKLLVRAYPAGSHNEAQIHYHAAALLSERGVRVAHVLHFTETPFRNGMVFLIEEYVEGAHRCGSDLTPADIHQFAMQVARLHSIKCDSWGPPLAHRTEEYAEVLLRRVNKRIDRLVQREVIADPLEAVRIRRWFADRLAMMGGLKGFSLTHGQLHRENILFTPEGEAVLLDYSTLQYALPYVDLVYINHHMLAGDEALIQAFQLDYLQESSQTAYARFVDDMKLFTAIFYLSRINSRWKRERRRGTHQDERLETLRQSQYLQKLRWLVDGGGGSSTH